jgi:hypothetical protein
MSHSEGHRPGRNDTVNSIPPENRSFALPRMGSERSFGIQIGTVLAIIGLWPLAAGGSGRPWALIFSALVLLCAAFVPGWLRPLNRLWFRFGTMLAGVVTPVVMGILFFLIVTPLALLQRLFGKDALRLKRDASVSSYWVVRTPPGPGPGSMRDQF